MFCNVGPSSISPYLSEYPGDSDPSERPSATELRRHPYLIRPPGWVFSDFVGSQEVARDEEEDDY